MTSDLRFTVLEHEVAHLRGELLAVRAAVRGELAGEPIWRAVLQHWQHGDTTLASALDTVMANRRALGL